MDCRSRRLFFPLRRFKRVRVCVRANCHVGVGQGARASVRVCVSMQACRHFVFCLYFPMQVHVRMLLSACRGGYFEMFHILGGHFRAFDSQRHLFSYSSFLLSVLALEPTIIYSCLGCWSRDRWIEWAGLVYFFVFFFICEGWQ